MNPLELGFLALLFLAVFGLVLVMLARMGGDPVQQRLADVGRGVPRGSPGAQRPWSARTARWAATLGQLSAPEGGAEHSLIRTRFLNAGLRHPTAPALYFAAKTALAIALPMLCYLVLNVARSAQQGNKMLIILLLAAACGYYLPNLLLGLRVRQRQRDIFESFPDALDLMTVCVEAGLATDAALNRVAHEIGLRSRILSEELMLVTLELRAGNPKERALRNLAMRTGVDDVDALVAMLIQAERFGTSIAASLRVQSDVLRTKRRQRAEEAAAKIALKLLFPLIFFIFPCLLVVLMGPAFIQIYRVLLPGMGAE
jgi:tight adherence protein C